LSTHIIIPRGAADPDVTISILSVAPDGVETPFSLAGMTIVLNIINPETNIIAFVLTTTLTTSGVLVIGGVGGNEISVQYTALLTATLVNHLWEVWKTNGDPRRLADGIWSVVDGHLT